MIKFVSQTYFSYLSFVVAVQHDIYMMCELYMYQLRFNHNKYEIRVDCTLCTIWVTEGHCKEKRMIWQNSLSISMRSVFILQEWYMYSWFHGILNVHLKGIIHLKENIYRLASELYQWGTHSYCKNGTFIVGCMEFWMFFKGYHPFQREHLSFSNWTEQFSLLKQFSSVATTFAQLPEAIPTESQLK